MRVLMLSSSPNILNPDSEDATRINKYRGLVEKLDVKIISGFWTLSNKLTIVNLFDRYDLITAQDPFWTGLTGYFLKKKLGVPLIIDLHGDFFNPQASWLKADWRVWLFRPISKFLVKRADGIRAVSQGVADSVIKLGVDKNKVAVIPVAVNLDEFKANQQSAISNQQSVLFVGSLEKVKNIPLLLLAVAKTNKQLNASVELFIAGTGSQKKRLKKIGQKLNINARFLGKLSRDELISQYQKTSMLILPSLSESFGRVLVEANACGKPVIATDTSGAREIIKDGYNGFIIPQKDAASLAEKISALVKNTALAKQMGVNGRLLVENKFGYNNLIQKLINFWEKSANESLK